MVCAQFSLNHQLDQVKMGSLAAYNCPVEIFNNRCIDLLWVRNWTHVTKTLKI